ncbi:hypothetical protein VQ643_07690 [Pseudomonas sp. F1_0610]|uniref:hypothetical protein n=1 Tax=Pseudomonas sp. F1_0610 TaxID=3114284 RepID=UPI0039C2CB5D
MENTNQQEKSALTDTAAKPSKSRYTLRELLDEAEVAGVYPLLSEEREWIDAPPVGREWPNDEQ